MRPKTTVVYAPSDVSVLERLTGAFVIFSFVSTWISSIFSPFLLAAVLWYQYNILAAVMVLISILAYLPWEKGQMSRACNRFVFYYFTRYFQCLSLDIEDYDDNPQNSGKLQQTFYAVHPHGAFSFGWATLFCAPQLQHVRFCFAPALYISPFFRLFSRSTGNPGSAGKADMQAYMKKGLSLALPPGGFEEATLTSTNHDRVYIKNRTGFVKLCLQNGIAVRPVYCFGEKGLYWNIQGGWDFRLKVLNRNGLPAIITWGHPLIPLLPRSNVGMKIVVGAPLALPQINNPSKEVVKQWHDKYVAALIKLFEDHKEDYYGREKAKTVKLEVW